MHYLKELDEMYYLTRFEKLSIKREGFYYLCIYININMHLHKDFIVPLVNFALGV